MNPIVLASLAGLGFTLAGNPGRRRSKRRRASGKRVSRGLRLTFVTAAEKAAVIARRKAWGGSMLAKRQARLAAAKAAALDAAKGVTEPVVVASAPAGWTYKTMGNPVNGMVRMALTGAERKFVNELRSDPGYSALDVGGGDYTSYTTNPCRNAPLTKREKQALRRILRKHR
jgi:hypothetical protein